MGRTKVIFISCVILVLYLVCMYHVSTPNTRFSDPLPCQSVKQTEKETVSPGTVNLRKSSLDESVLLTSKHQQNYMGNQNEPSTSRKESNLLVGKTVLKKDKDMTATELAQELEKKIEAIPVDQLLPESFTETCSPKEIKVGGCGGASKCKYRTKLPESYEDRINQLVNKRLQIQPDHLKVIQSMGDQFKKRPEFLIITGASSNHYLESQAMIRLVHKHIPRDLSFEFIFYDLGLQDEERNMMKKFCNCTVLVFPFSAFPEHVKELRCYGWKAPIIYAHIQHADVVMWADASIRMSDKAENLEIQLQRTKQRGVVQANGGDYLSQHTLAQMFHYFGDEPCAYKSYRMRKATGVLYHNEPFVRQAILTPWVACSLVKNCMCPEPPKTSIKCSGVGPRWERPYGNCHRFDQSALNIILSKLYQRAIYHTIITDHGCFFVRREDRFPYFYNLNRTLFHQRSDKML